MGSTGESGVGATDRPIVATRLELSEAQVDELRRACCRHARALGLSPDAADLLAEWWR